MFSDRGVDVGGLTFGKGRMRFSLEIVEGRPSLVVRGSENYQTVVFDLGKINIAPIAGDPASPTDGDIWYDDTAGLFQFRQEGVTESLSGDDAPVNATYVVASADATLTAELVLGTAVIMAGLAAARPAAGTAGRLYLETDTSGGTLFRDTGAAWVQVAPGVTGGSGHTIRENGTDQTTRTGLNFIDASAGAGLITDDAGNNETEVNLNLYLLADGTRAMTGDLDTGGNDIFNVRNYYPDPGGRLTLTAATPVLVADAADQTTIYYALYKHDLVPIFDGTNWDVFRFTELSIAMGGDADWAADSNYDLYVINDGGTLRLATGTVWTNSTTRSADTIARLNGRWVNSTTHTMRYGPGVGDTVSVTVNRGTYVGTIRTTGAAGTTTMEFGGSADGGNPILFYIWNAYNQAWHGAENFDTTDSWTYASATIRSKNNNANNRWTFVRGLNEQTIIGTNHAEMRHSEAGGQLVIGWGLDSTTAFTGPTGLYDAPVVNFSVQAATTVLLYPGLGLHFLQALEATQASNTGTFFGDNAGSLYHSSLVVGGWF